MKNDSMPDPLHGLKNTKNTEAFQNLAQTSKLKMNGLWINDILFLASHGILDIKLITSTSDNGISAK